jgi:hypothetical protein
VTGAEAVEDALTYLRAHLHIAVLREDDYHVIQVAGCDDDDATHYIGRFLVGAIAEVVRTDLVLQEALISEGLDGQAELKRDVEKIIGAEGTTLSSHERTHGRDPWIGEALGQMIFVLSDQAPHPCVPAPMVAAHLPHVEAREHGLDLFGFCSPELMVVVGEAKTSKANISGLLTAAEEALALIETGGRDHHLRQAVNGLQLSLPEDLRPLLAGAIWKRARCYLPLLCFESGLDLGAARAALTELVSNGAECRLVAIQHPNHDAFFEAVAQAMRDAIPVIAPS